MNEVTIIDTNLARKVHPLHEASADGEVMFRKRLSCRQVLALTTRLDTA